MSTEDIFLNVEHENYDWSTETMTRVPASGTVWWYNDDDYVFSIVGNGTDDVETLRAAQTRSDSAWTTVTSPENGWVGTLQYIIMSGTVTVVCAGGLSGSAATSDTMLTLASRYRPNTSHRVRMSRNTNDDQSTRLSVGSTGVVSASASSVTSGSFTISYPVL